MGTEEKEEDHPVAVNINKLLQTLPGEPPRHSIYRVPKNVRDNADKRHYEPQLVSIGPYHRSKEHLRAMEERKRLYLRRFLDGCGPGTLQQCIGSLEAREDKARACYFEDSGSLDSAQFVEMLLLDGVFLLLFFLDSAAAVTTSHSATVDPVFGAAWSLPLLHTDLLMLENQIPYFVLLAIYEVYRRQTAHPPTVDHPPLTRLILQFFTKYGRFQTSRTLDLQLHEPNIDHLLDLYYHHFIAPPKLEVPNNKHQGQPNSPPAPKTVPCAKELSLHGVSFRPRYKHAFKVHTDKDDNIFDVVFDKDAGVLEIPELVIRPLTCTVFLNLVAFEQSKRGAVMYYFSSYVMLLDNLVNTVDDVLVLNKSKVLVNMLPNEEEAAKFFNQLCACAYIDDENHYLADVHRGLDEFCGKSWPKYKAMFRRNYHSSPWSIFGFYMGSLLALLTVFTTIVNILDKFTHVLKR